MILQELIVPLLMDTTGFEKGVDTATSKSQTLKNKLASFGSKAVLAGIAGLTAGVAVLGSAIASSIQKTIKWADELDALQDVTNFTTDQVAGLNYVLRKHGVEANTAAKAFTYLNKQLVEYDGELGITGRALENYGINVKDVNGNVKDNATLLQEIANKYSSMSEGQERINFLTQAFGRSSTELNDALLELGDKGLSSFIEKAQKLGINIDADAVQQYKQSLEELKLIGESIQISWGSKLIPVLKEILDYFGSFAGLSFDEIIAKLQFDWDRIDWDKVNEKLNFSISGHDWSSVGKLIADIFVDSIKNIDWWALGNSLASLASNLFFGLFGHTEATAQKIIKNTLNGIAYDIERWVNRVLAYLAGLGVIKDTIRLVEIPKFDMSVPAGGSSTNNSGIPAGNYTYNPSTGQYTLNGRASGGAVIAGQAYRVAEFYKPEVFTPAVNGRIDKLDTSQKEVVARFDEDRLIRVLSSVLLQSQGV